MLLVGPTGTYGEFNPRSERKGLYIIGAKKK